MADAAALVATYFRSWREKDFDTLRSVLADDATFRGPLGTADDGDACLKGLQGMSQIVTDIVVLRTFADGDDVATVFELHTSIAPPVLTTNWSHVENGAISQIQVMFDPRPLVEAG